MSTNPELDLAFQFVENTNRNVFLTGKAGTGKTTFLRKLQQTSAKRMAIVAPTGVAAINAGGVTIHSFFQLPFRPLIPNNSADTQNNTLFERPMKKEKINLIKSLDLLIIDEISMVRCDVLDGIDEVLRRYRNFNLPFGGLQLLMIGDLHQLSPISKTDEWNLLQAYYPNQYFFSSIALNKTNPLRIELKHIYRQTDSVFIDLLNSVRDNKLTKEILTNLNQRYIPDFSPDENQGYITLTTHNRNADEINTKKLSQLSAKSSFFQATITDIFDERSYPTLFNLELKIGAQVMFIKNDSSMERLFFNGKIGKVTAIEKDKIRVKCVNDALDIEVGQMSWTSIKYTLNPQTKLVEETILGSFTQFPLKLAWAITIHKSQGLTFEKAIIDAGSSFAFGQVYVALSRCKSLEGMVLKSAIESSSIKSDHIIDGYTLESSKLVVSEAHLTESKIKYQQDLVCELMDFEYIKKLFNWVNKIANTHESVLLAGTISQIRDMQAEFQIQIYQVSLNFKNQLYQIFSADLEIEQDEKVRERIAKGCVYFADKLDLIVLNNLSYLHCDTDNQTVRISLQEAVDKLKKQVFIKWAILKKCASGFSTLTYLQGMANADLDYEAQNKGVIKATKTDIATLKDIKHPELYQVIIGWRNQLADENNIIAYTILPQKSVVELVTMLPTNIKELEQISGIGKVKIKQYGQQILEMIDNYCKSKGIEGGSVNSQTSQIKKLPKTSDTQTLSLQLFKAGNTIEQIASQRSMVFSTIESHLVHFILEGNLKLSELVSEEKSKQIIDYLQANPDCPSGQAKADLGHQISYTELKAVRNHLAFIKIEQQAQNL